LDINRGLLRNRSAEYTKRNSRRKKKRVSDETIIKTIECSSLIISEPGTKHVKKNVRRYRGDEVKTTKSTFWIKGDIRSLLLDVSQRLQIEYGAIVGVSIANIYKVYRECCSKYIKPIQDGNYHHCPTCLSVSKNFANVWPQLKDRCRSACRNSNCHLQNNSLLRELPNYAWWVLCQLLCTEESRIGVHPSCLRGECQRNRCSTSNMLAKIIGCTGVSKLEGELD